MYGYFACIYACIHGHEVPKKAGSGFQIPLGIEVQMVVSCHMGAGNEVQSSAKRHTQHHSHEAGREERQDRRWEVSRASLETLKAHSSGNTSSNKATPPKSPAS